MKPDEEKRYRVESEKEMQVQVVLVWSDSPAQPNQSVQLVNDLDMVLLDAQGNEILPYILDPALPETPASRGKDHINVEEQVVTPDQSQGPFTIVVTGNYLPEGAWNFALAGVSTSTCDSDEDGYFGKDCHGDDCDDTGDAVHPGAVEICDDAIDNDCNDLTDGEDPACLDDDDDNSDDDNDDSDGDDTAPSVDDDDDDSSGCCG